MRNAVSIKLDGVHHVTVLVPKGTCDIEEVLDSYAGWNGCRRDNITGEWVAVLDFTADFPFRLPYSRQEFTKKEVEIVQQSISPQNYTVVVLGAKRLIHRFTDEGSYVNVSELPKDSGECFCGTDYKVKHKKDYTIKDVLKSLGLDDYLRGSL